jgi:hypothetical protein
LVPCVPQTGRRIQETLAKIHLFQEEPAAAYKMCAPAYQVPRRAFRRPGNAETGGGGSGGLFQRGLGESVSQPESEES